MKKILSYILFAFALLPLAANAQGLRQQADAAYAEENYQQAAGLYEEILQSGMESHEVYYNLGCSYYRMNELGQAILNYERALRLKPHDSDTRENLELCYSRTQDNIQKLPQSIVGRAWRGLVGWLTLRGWLVVVLGLLACSVAGVVWFLLGTGLGQRRASLVASAVAAVLLLLSAGCALQAGADSRSHDEAIVMRPLADAKVSPNADGTSKFTLHEGTKVAVEEQIGDWLRIRIADGNRGWMRSDELERI